MTERVPVQLAYLEAGGTGILLDIRDGDVVVAHWGSPLPAPLPDPQALRASVPHSAFDEPVRPSLVPQAARGWLGRPGILGSRDDGSGYSPLLVADSVEADDRRAVIGLSGDGLAVTVEVAIDDHGMVQAHAELRNTGDRPYRLESLSLALPVPDRAGEILDYAGRWAKEKQEQRHALRFGTWTRESRHGRTGHDATGVLAVGTRGFGFGRGEVWGVHLGWSGDHEHRVERLGTGSALLSAGELLHPGEIVLDAGDVHRTPTLYAAHSTEGLDGLSARFHRHLRSRPGHPRGPRPVVLNTWEAVYFRHELAELSELAETAAQLGVERFVLDDGWFLGRRDDTRGLGDWIVDPRVWPDGLGPLIEVVESHGMRFGLWVEPEMVNEDSELARAHPDWIAGPAARRSPEWRNQQVLDFVNPAAFAHILGRLDALLAEHPGIAFLKWDQNRDQPELGSGGRASTHAQTLAAYRLIDELRMRHPGVEIESCSSGGARVDLGILQRTDRVWASDMNDALERQQIQRGTHVLLPPELVGSHVGPSTAHTTGRTHDLSFRAITALIGHFGIEWDVREASDSDRGELAAAIRFYKEHRDLLHSGRLVHADDLDPSTTVTGVVADDGSAAVFVWAVLAATPGELPQRVLFPGLDRARVYRVSLGLDVPRGITMHRTPPAWFPGPVELTGAALGEIGLPMPLLMPEHAILFDLKAVE